MLLFFSTSTVTLIKDTPTLLWVTGIYIIFKGGYNYGISRAEERDY